MLLIVDNLTKIYKIKRSLINEFEINDLDHVKRILGMDIIRNRPNRILILRQSSCVEKVFKLCMHDSKSMTIQPASLFKLSKDQCPTIDTNLKYMKNVPYANVVGSIT